MLAALGPARASGGTLPLFVEDDEVLRRRFTRRRHPLTDLPGVGDALAAERELMAPVKLAADLLIDTSDLSLPDLRRLLTGPFGVESLGLTITVMSFAYRNGLPREADLTRRALLHNPHYVDALRPASGQDAGVQEHIRDPAFDRFVADLRALLPLLPRYRSEGKSYLTIAFGCTGGKHRSVFLAELMARWLLILAGRRPRCTVIERDAAGAVRRQP